MEGWCVGEGSEIRLVSLMVVVEEVIGVVRFVSGTSGRVVYEDGGGDCADVRNVSGVGKGSWDEDKEGN